MNQSGNEFKPTTFFEYILTYHRGTFATIFLIPLSVTYGFFEKIANRIKFLFYSAPKAHNKKVQKIQEQIKSWAQSGSNQKLCTARSGWKTMSELVPAYKKTSHLIELNLVDILSIDEQKQTVKVEPLVNMGQISRYLLKRGWTLPVIPELDDLTVGGLIMGFGVEGSSHKYGLFQYIVESMDIATSDGNIIHCSANENAELFYSIPWSHGTLGFLVMAELKIIPATRFVKLHYQPLVGKENIFEAFEKASRNTAENDFVEMLMYSREKAVLMTGKRVNETGTDGKVNNIGHYYKPWFYKHVETYLHDNKSGVEYIPLIHYYHRHTRSLFWEMSEIIPFGNNPLFRWLLGWALPPRLALLKYFESDTTRRLREKYHMVQDMLMPISLLNESLDYFDEHIKIYPLWVCPMLVKQSPENIGMIKPYQKPDGSLDELFVDIGAYGTSAKPGFDGIEELKKLEQFVISHHGYQAMYARTTMTKQDFRKMFDHTVYDKLRKEIPLTERAFPEIFDKLGGRARISPAEYKKMKATEQSA